MGVKRPTQARGVGLAEPQIFLSRSLRSLNMTSFLDRHTRHRGLSSLLDRQGAAVSAISHRL